MLEAFTRQEMMLCCSSGAQVQLLTVDPVCTKFHCDSEEKREKKKIATAINLSLVH